jgi:hypothetical protein
MFIYLFYIHHKIYVFAKLYERTKIVEIYMQKKLLEFSEN